MSYRCCSLVEKADAISDTSVCLDRCRVMFSEPKKVRKRSFSLPSKYTLNDFTFFSVPNLVSLSSGSKL